VNADCTPLANFSLVKMCLEAPGCFAASGAQALLLPD
jgi:hypothetical protein